MEIAIVKQAPHIDQCEFHRQCLSLHSVQFLPQNTNTNNDDNAAAVSNSQAPSLLPCSHYINRFTNHSIDRPENEPAARAATAATAATATASCSAAAAATTTTTTTAGATPRTRGTRPASTAPSRPSPSSTAQPRPPPPPSSADRRVSVLRGVRLRV